MIFSQRGREQAIAYEARAPWADAPPDPRYHNPNKAARRREERENERETDKYDRVAPILREEIKGGKWHRKTRADRIAAEHKLKVRTLCDRAGVAISDFGTWICLPDHDTPAYAPDEIDTKGSPDAS